jgi:hypothetical protein
MAVRRALEVIRTLDRATTRRPLPREAPMGLVTDAWRPYIREQDGAISRRYYELCTLWSLRSALRAGHIWGAHSRLYANPDTYLIPPAEWPCWRPEGIRQTGIPSDGATRLTEREAELERAMADVEQLLARKDSHLRVEKDQIVLSQSTDLSYRRLAWCMTWHRREDTLKAAVTTLVNFTITSP